MWENVYELDFDTKLGNNFCGFFPEYLSNFVMHEFYMNSYFSFF